MKTTLPAYPLITCDPYFSLWSFGDRLNEAEVTHWTGAVKPITGDLYINGQCFRFLGTGGTPAPQTDLDITPTSSTYSFQEGNVLLKVRFTTPLLLNDLELCSRPASYIDFEITCLDGASREIRIEMKFDETLCYHKEKDCAIMGRSFSLSHLNAAWMGKKKQPLLSHSGDDLTIDWGYLYLALPERDGSVCYLEEERSSLVAALDFKTVSGHRTAFLTAAYDDIASINYFGTLCKGYWARNGKTAPEMVKDAVLDHERALTSCDIFDEQLLKQAVKTAGEDYALLCTAAYRQSIAAHKLITNPNGNPAFISKECFSNGCAATVDVSYPSIPLYLLYNPELVLGMMRPILDFARMDAWPFDFAPHDAGRYPYLCGNVYGLSPEEQKKHPAEGEIYPPYYSFPASSSIYGVENQMPVEECGNLLLMAAAVQKRMDCRNFLEENLDLFSCWVTYLIRYGADPEEQLCTDDFAGHLAHNINLAAKAIMGIEAYAQILSAVDRKTESEWYHEKALSMAEDWYKNSAREDHTALVFDRKDGWSLKYNLVFDKYFQSGLFPEAVYQKETAWYCGHQNTYGVPLDSRADYTKSDWIAWTAALSSDLHTREALLKPVAEFLRKSPDKMPFSDWYDTKTAKVVGFRARSVQGGIFMPMLMDKIE